MKKINRSSDYFFYVSATLISAIVHFIYSIYVKAKISPLEYGIYSSCLLLNTYMTYIQLGSLNAFNRDYPQILGEKNPKKAKECRDTIFTFIFFLFLIATCCVVLVVHFIGHFFSVDMRYVFGLDLCAVLTFVSVIENFLCSRVRCDGGFMYNSLTILVELLSVVIGILMIKSAGHYSLYITSICAMLIGIAMYYKRGLSDIRFKINKLLLKEMVMSGTPLLINNMIWTLVNSVDKFVILTFINTEALGVYSIAQMAFSYVVLIPNALSQLFYVRMGKAYGTTKDKNILIETGSNYTFILAMLLSFIVLCAYFFLEPVVNLIMPNYAPGVNAAKILMIALALYAPTMVNSNLLTILKKNVALIRSSTYILVLNLFFSIVFVIFNGANINSVALGTAVSYLFRAFILIFQLKKSAGVKMISMINSSIIPIVATIVPGLIIYYLIDNLFISFICAIVASSLSFLIIYRNKLKKIIKGDIAK